MKDKFQHTQKNIFSVIFAVSAACLVFAIMQGIHDNYGIMLPGIVSRSGISYAAVSFVIAVGQILYGATQPFFGMLAIKKSNAFVMFLGIVLMAAKIAVVYGSIFIGHQLGAFASAWLGGILVSTTFGYTALWIADLCLCTTATAASFKIKD